MATVAQLLQQGRHALAGLSDAPNLDAERLLLHALKEKDASSLYTHPATEVSDIQLEQWQAMLDKRKKGMPLAYLLGGQEFYGRYFLVNEHVLIPRPETEQLVERALLKIRQLHQRLKHPLSISDIGTGSGCIAITLALEAPEYIKHIYATDISSRALELARRNAQLHAVTDNFTFIQGNLLDPIQSQGIDLIVSNPPYVPSHEIDQALSCPRPETVGLQFEPRLALDGGPDGGVLTQVIRESGKPYVMEVTGGVLEENNI